MQTYKIGNYNIIIVVEHQGKATSHLEWHSHPVAHRLSYK